MKWITKMQTQYNKTPKRIRTDGGKEWDNNVTHEYAI